MMPAANAKVDLFLVLSVMMGATLARGQDPRTMRVVKSDSLGEGSILVTTYADLVSPVGDFDGDGNTDVAMALDDANYYLLYGQEGLWGTLFDSVTIRTRRPEIRYTRIQTPKDSPTLLAVGPAGDVDGDGFDDFVIVIAERIECGERCSDVTAYHPALCIILGQKSGLAGEVNIDELLPSCRATERLPPKQWRGWRRKRVTIMPVGDFNGDGLEDLGIIPCFTVVDGVDNAGGVVVRFGTPNICRRTIDLSDVGSDVPGIFLKGDLANEQIYTISSIGDFDGDETSDVAVSCYVGSGFPPRMYLLYGGRDVDGVYSPRTFPAQSIGLMTWLFPPAGISDLDDDGYCDIVLPVASQGGGTRGSVVVYGGRRETGTLSNSEFISRGRGVRFGGELGGKASGGVDLNGDGISEFMIGTGVSSDDGTEKPGQIHVVIGRRGFPALVLREDLLTTYGLLVEGAEDCEWIGKQRLGMIEDFDGDGQGEIFFTGGGYCASCFKGT